MGEQAHARSTPLLRFPSPPRSLCLALAPHHFPSSNPPVAFSSPSPALLAACVSLARGHVATGAVATKVGPPTGSVIVVGGGGQGPEVFAKFIELAGRPGRADPRRADRRRRYGLSAGLARARTDSRGRGREERLRAAHLEPQSRRRGQFRRAHQASRGHLVRGGAALPPRGLLPGHEDGARVQRGARARRCRRGFVGGRIDPRQLPRARCAVEQQRDHGVPRLSQGIRLSAWRRHRSACRRARTSRRSRRLTRLEVSRHAVHLRRRRHRVGGAGRRRRDHRAQQGVRVQRPGQDGRGQAVPHAASR